jgi:folate-dependent phosphoribosylglycinamide formyltransferase PurN
MLNALGRPLRVAVLCSGRAPGLVHLLNRDPRRGQAYEIVCCVTSDDTFAEEVRVERRGVPCVAHPFARFCRESGAARGDLDARARYDRETAALLEPHHPDLILLAGYLLLLTGPMLAAYPGRIVNVHHADLLARTADGAVRYPGLRAVRDAFLAGEAGTRATAHIVTERLDDGPVLVRSWEFPAPPVVRWALDHDAMDVIRAAAWAHTEWMLRDAWGPMLSAATDVAVRAFTAAATPLDPDRAGRWLLAADGTMTPDGSLVESLA